MFSLINKTVIELRIKLLTRAVAYLLSNTRHYAVCAETSGCKRVKAQPRACIARPFTQKACSRMKRTHAFCGRGGCPPFLSSPCYQTHVIVKN